MNPAPEGAPGPGPRGPSAEEARLRQELAAKQADLERERHQALQWRERYQKAKLEARELEERAGELHREAASRGAWSKELEETLRVVDKARARLSAALDASRREASALRARASSVQG